MRHYEVIRDSEDNASDGTHATAHTATFLVAWTSNSVSEVVTFKGNSLHCSRENFHSLQTRGSLNFGDANAADILPDLGASHHHMVTTKDWFENPKPIDPMRIFLGNGADLFASHARVLRTKMWVKQANSVHNKVVTFSDVLTSRN